MLFCAQAGEVQQLRGSPATGRLLQLPLCKWQCLGPRRSPSVYGEGRPFSLKKSSFFTGSPSRLTKHEETQLEWLSRQATRLEYSSSQTECHLVCPPSPRL